jgi:hypothetical protein
VKRAVLLAAATFAFAGVPAPVRADGPDAVRGLTFEHYYDGAALADALRAIHAAEPAWTRLEEMGRSREGRPLWAMTVFDPSGPPLERRPAMYVDGNTHGNEVQGTEICLYTIRHLLTHRADPWIAALLKRAAFLIAPCVNPDSRERFLHSPGDEHSPRRVPRPVDDDRDGRVDEDGPDDLDGDGEILQMRVKDPDGDWVVDERDDRLMRPRKPDEQGQYRLLGSEGLDDDGDGLVNEDPIGGVDPNRNWPTDWRPEPDQGGAGPYPLSEPETRATALWILSRPHVAAVQSFHNAGQMILRPPGGRTDKEAELPESDKALYDELGRRGMVLLPGYRYMKIREELYRVQGGFLDWTAFGLGVFSFTNEVWGLFGWGTGVDDGQKKALEWNDVALHGEGFVRWHEVKHPTYGVVEVGGWKRYTMRSTPVDFLPDLCLRNCLFTLEHAASMPELAVSSATREDGGRRVRVTVENRGMLPTVSTWSERHGVLPPDELRVEGARVGAAVEVVKGSPPAPLTVRAGRALLPGGLRGKSIRTFDLFVEAGDRAASVTVVSRVGGEASAPVR